MIVPHLAQLASGIPANDLQLLADWCAHMALPVRTARCILSSGSQAFLHPLPQRAHVGLAGTSSTLHTAASASSTAERLHIADASTSGRVESNWRFLNYLLPAAAAAALGTAVAYQQQFQVEPPSLPVHASLSQQPHPLDSMQPWVQQLAQDKGVLEVLTADKILEHPLLGGDHMFSALMRKGFVSNMACFYNSDHQRFHSVLTLGKETAGYPGIVHGGLSAAILDETLGLLFFALKSQGALPFWGPAFTANLEVNYKAKLPTGNTVLCTSELESVDGRKVWMTATISDGPHGKVYATARALFVAPKPQKLLQEGAKHVWSQLQPPT